MPHVDSPTEGVDTSLRPHDWMLDEDGEVDQTAWFSDNGWHNGPRCLRCGEGYCRHCTDPDAIPCAAEPSGGKQAFPREAE